ncbi:hypothetical protein PAS25_09245 [Leclercia adecarboxylata]|uniref:NACHT domain-containing protein n=1 Tax=Leclercia adecarboxylata TaxID=83655 RepID=UPI00111A624E|nr:hypothetical protein [Leclercia adecarboxylata]QCZ29583.1 hypothetical protein FHN83_24360 [Leclercia adecarboxylata]
MLNRQVRQIYPQKDKDTQTAVFSDYSHFPNIVLLGDPGAGKTHLFKQFAALQEAKYLTVRHFLSGVPIDNQKTLFIDALDEKRSASNSSDVVDDIIHRLFSQTPQNVRISCRSQDWLGESDLSAFLPYFEQTGGYVVLHLQSLSTEEQTAILQANGVEHPEAFLAEAEKHDASEFLYNPQNLIMLAEAVKEGNWPRTRSELFHSATQFLLTEHSTEHTRLTSGIHNCDELEYPAGSICALRILSDVSGVSLLPNDIRPEYPSYRTISFFSHEIIRAALSRRVFSAGDELETVDYSHRTIAEYLAAKWLAGIVDKGLPMGRLRSMLGFEGYPSSELRGLHAWLAVFLPQYAQVFIDTDPYGVLTYGDAASLPIAEKQNLLVALSKLSERDPWFRNHGLNSYLNGFATVEMEALLRQIVRDPHSSFSLRMIVLESLSVATPIVALSDDLINIVKSKDSSYAEKEEAITALIHFGVSGQKFSVRLFAELNDKNHDSIRLRNHIIQLLYKDHFTPQDIAQLLIDTLNITSERLPIGALWRLNDIVPTADLLAIFEHLDRYHTAHSKDWYSSAKNHYEIVYFLEAGLLRILSEKNGYSASQIWLCLKTFYFYSHHHHYRGYDNVQKSVVQEIKNRSWQYEDIIDAAILSFKHYDTHCLFLHEFGGSTFHLIPDEVLLARFIHFFSHAEADSDKTECIYRLTFAVLYRCAKPSQQTFEFLSAYCHLNVKLTAVFETSIVCEIDDWRVKHKLSQIAYEKKRNAALYEDRHSFELCRQEIVSGQHLEWLKHISYIYYSKYSDVDDKLTPVQRCADILGAENVTDAISGLLAILNRSDLPTIDEVNCTFLKGKYYKWWYAVLAGSDELFKKNSDVTQWDEDLLTTLLALDVVLALFTKDNNVISDYSLPWKRDVILNKTAFFIKTYYHIITFYINNQLQDIRALNYLLNDTCIPIDYAVPLVMRLAKEHPDDVFHLQNLVGWLLAHPESHAELLQLSELMIAQPSKLKKQSYQIWLVCAYLFAPDQCQDQFLSESKSATKMIMFIRQLSGKAKRGRGSSEQRLSLTQLETIITVSAIHFPNIDRLASNVSNSTNNWEYADFIKRMIDDVSSFSSYDAGKVFERLLLLPECTSYRDYLLHAQSNQKVRYRESQFQHTNWKQAVNILKNQTPANVMDLYALLLDHLRDIANRITYENTDIYKQFWNENGNGQIVVPKPEESCRNFFLELLRVRLHPLQIICEPEGHMVSSKRADIIISLPGIKIPIEIKRDYHRNVWSALNEQLDQLYTTNPDAAGYGIYLVFWFGASRPNAIPRPEKDTPPPVNATTMEDILNEAVPMVKRNRLSAIVIDVSGEANSTIETQKSSM